MQQVFNFDVLNGLLQVTLYVVDLSLDLDIFWCFCSPNMILSYRQTSHSSNRVWNRGANGKNLRPATFSSWTIYGTGLSDKAVRHARWSGSHLSNSSTVTCIKSEALCNVILAMAPNLSHFSLFAAPAWSQSALSRLPRGAEPPPPTITPPSIHSANRTRARSLPPPSRPHPIPAPEISSGNGLHKH